MKINNTLKISFRNILKNKTRSFLTSLGIIIGVCSVTIMVGIGEGTKERIQNEIASLGTNLIIISPGAGQVGGVRLIVGTMPRLSLEDVEYLKNEGSYIEAISPIITTNEQVIGGGSNWRSFISGVSPDYQRIRDLSLSSGEFFKEQDVKTNKSVAVIGQTIATQLFPDNDPVGMKIRIGKTPFKIIGLLESKGKSSFGDDLDDIILVPYTTLYNKVSGGRFLRNIYVSTISSDFINKQQDEIRTILRIRHKLRETDPDDFTIGTQTEIAESASSIAGLMTLLLGSIAAVSLLVGGIGIMNIMLVSVTERTREIGTRLAVGARSKDIMLQFLIESLVLSLTGGFIGILISFIASFLMNKFSTITLVINIKIIFIAVIFSGIVGLFFGLYPAKKASDLNPIDALRYE